jgi:hypothetical protein
MSHWFKPHSYGYGATPANWKGWAVSLAFGIAVAASTLVLAASQQIAGSDPNIWLICAWLAGVGLLTGAFICLTRAKTDGHWGWRWGK